MVSGLRHILTAVMAALCCLAAAAQAPAPPDLHIKYYKGYKWTLDEAGDSMIVYYLTDLVVYPPLRFKNEKQKKEYDRLMRNVRITLPYAKLIAETLVETYEYIETLPTKKDREAYLKRMEKEIYEQYKPTFKKFSRTQAKILIKLIQRETNQSSYDIVKAFMGSLRAAFWQGFGKLMGVSLKSSFNPDKDATDARIDRIASQVELGLL